MHFSNVALPMGSAMEPSRIVGLVKVSVRLHAKHSLKGSMGPDPDLFMVSEPTWVDDGQ